MNPEPEKERADPKVNILLVDDQLENLLALETILQDLGQNLIRAQSGREALKQVLARDFALILLDVRMPTMDGFETAALIRERPQSRHTPIIFLTAGLTNEQQVFQGYASGAVDYLVKPVVPEILRSKAIVFVELAKKTELIRRQAELLEQRERAARELAEEKVRLLEEIQNANISLTATNKELEAFSYSVSHDLRTPLRAIDGFSRELLENFYSQLDEVGKDDLRRIRAAAQRMSQLIEDLLKLSRVTRGEMTRVEVNLSATVERILHDLRGAHPERRVDWQIAPHLKAVGDPQLLRVVLQNLAENAWKFTEKRSPAKIEFDQTVHAGTAAFYIRDNGVGFNMAYASKLFGAFQRLHDAKEFPGTGVGLATVQRIIHRHGGRIWAEAEVDRGATFYFTLGSPRHSKGAPA
jgi:two-component system sensor histidine kinase/response regulator